MRFNQSFKIGSKGVLVGGTSSKAPNTVSSVKSMTEQSNDYRIVVFGAGGVGKSSLVLRFVKGKCDNFIYLFFFFQTFESDLS